MREDGKDMFLLAGQPTVKDLNRNAYDRKKASIGSENAVELGMNQLVEIDMLKSPVVLAEGAGPCLVAYLKYGTTTWVWHDANNDLSKFAQQAAAKLAEKISESGEPNRGEAYLTLFGHSPLSAQVVKNLGVDYASYQQETAVQRKSLPLILQDGTSHTVPVVVKSFLSDTPNQGTSTIFNSQENTIWYTTNPIK